MKKLGMVLGILLCVSMVMFAGGKKDAGASGKQRIAVSLPPANNSWQAKMLQVIALATTNYPEYDWTVKSAIDDNDQLNQLTIFRNDKYDAMVILPGNGTLLTPICEQIFNDGTKTIILDRGINSDNYTALVMGDNYGGGVNAARVLGQKMGGQGSVVILRFTIGIPIDDQRTGGFKDTLTKEFPNIKIIADVDSTPTREGGLRSMTNVLPAHEQIDAVYTEDDETALGALSAIRNANRNDIKYITGFGGTLDTYAMFIKNDPVYLASMSYFPSMGGDGVDMAAKILKGQTFPKDSVLPSQVVDATNVQDYMKEAY